MNTLQKLNKRNYGPNNSLATVQTNNGGPPWLLMFVFVFRAYERSPIFVVVEAFLSEDYICTLKD